MPLDDWLSQGRWTLSQCNHNNPRYSFLSEHPNKKYPYGILNIEVKERPTQMRVTLFNLALLMTPAHAPFKGKPEAPC